MDLITDHLRLLSNVTENPFSRCLHILGAGPRSYPYLFGYDEDHIITAEDKRRRSKRFLKEVGYRWWDFASYSFRDEKALANHPYECCELLHKIIRVPKTHDSALIIWKNWDNKYLKKGYLVFDVFIARGCSCDTLSKNLPYAMDELDDFLSPFMQWFKDGGVSSDYAFNEHKILETIDILR